MHGGEDTTYLPIDKILSLGYFICIVAVLLLGNFGLLTIPGIMISIFCIIAVYYRRFSVAAVISILAATTSFIAQALTGWCISCIIAATMFVIAGLLTSSRKIQLLFGIPILFGLLIFILPGIVSKDSSVSYPVSPSLHTSKPNISDYEKEPNNSIALLYVSAYCPSCKEVLKQYIESDPQGEYWRPVIVSSGQVGKSMLMNMGYVGEQYLDPSPAKIVPCLEIGQNKYVGMNKILSVYVPGKIPKM